MLPNGRLAKHGYSVDYGYGFVGTCIGSGELPFEVSKDFIVSVVADMQRKIDTHIPAVVPQISYGAMYSYKKTPEELDEYTAYKRAIEHNNQHKSRQQFVAMQRPLIANWSEKPLKERAAEESVVEAKKAANRGIREAARTRDDAKRAWSKACDKLRKVAGEYANRPFQASRDAAGNPNYDLYVDFPYEATNTSAKITAMARMHCHNAPEIVELANQVDDLLAAFKAAKCAHAALKA